MLVFVSVSTFIVWHQQTEQQNAITHWVDATLMAQLANLSTSTGQLQLRELSIPAEQMNVWRGDQLVTEVLRHPHPRGSTFLVERAGYRIEFFVQRDWLALCKLWGLWLGCWLVLSMPAFLLLMRQQRVAALLAKSGMSATPDSLEHGIDELLKGRSHLQQQLELRQQDLATLQSSADNAAMQQRQHAEQIQSLTTLSQSAQRELQWIKALLQQFNSRGSVIGVGFEVELLKRYLHTPTQAKLTQFGSVAEWYAETLRKPLLAAFPGTRFLLDEDPTSLQYKVAIEQQDVKLAVDALLRELKPLLQTSELDLGYRIVLQPRPAIELSFKYQGYEFSPRFQKIMRHELAKEPSLQDLPAHLLASFVEHRGFSWQLDSVTGVGGKICLTIPAVIERVNQSKRFQTLCLLDPLECRATMYRKSLQTIAEQIIWVRQLDDLQTELKLRLVDKVLAFFDEQPSEHTVRQLEDVAQRYAVRVCVESVIKLPEDSEVQWWSAPLFTADLLQSSESIELGRQQLLVVDDNPVNMNFVETMMASMGVKVDKAFTGEEALQKARTNIYHVILMDIQLPDISGVEVTRQVRQMRHHQMTNIIAFTAHAMPDEVASFRLAGMDDVVIKPMDSRKVAHLVHRLHLTPEIQ